MERGWRAIRTTIAAVATIGMLAATPAIAETRMVVARGPCSGDSHWRMELVKAHGKIEVGFKVVEGIVGDVWRVRVAHGRRIIFRGQLATHGDDGSFAIHLLTRDRPGPDLFRARARNLSTDEFCLGRAVIW